jgi:hypothetical protein
MLEGDPATRLSAERARAIIGNLRPSLPTRADRAMHLEESMMLAQVGFVHGGRLLEPPPYQRHDLVSGCWRPLVRAKTYLDPLLPPTRYIYIDDENMIPAMPWPSIWSLLEDPRVISAHVHAIMSHGTLLSFTIDIVNKWGDHYLVETHAGAVAHAKPITINSSRRDNNPSPDLKRQTTYSFSSVPCRFEATHQVQNPHHPFL